MKLYATITSERASKGQGGNKYLVTEYTIEEDGGDYIDFGSINLYVGENEEGEHAYILAYNGEEIASRPIEQKGKRQKGETCEHSFIDNDNEGVYGSSVCRFCGKTEEQKGKRQKGETRLGTCHCGYPCIYGTDYCERHQIP